MPFKDPEKRAAYFRARDWRAADGTTILHNEGCVHLTSRVPPALDCSCEEIVVGGIGVHDRNKVAQDERKGRAGFAARAGRFVFVDTEGLTFHRPGCRGEAEEACRCPHSTLLVAAHGGEVGKEQTFRIENEAGISTRAIWDFLLSLPERFGPAVYVGYGFGYDTEMLLPPRGETDPRTGWDRLDRLDNTGACRYGPYQFVVWERKRFAVKRLEGEPLSRICVDDLLSSFGGKPFEAVVDKFLPPTFFTPEERALLAEGKAKRSVWTVDDYRSGFVRQYNELELRAGVAIVRSFNECRREVGVVSSDFYSPAVIAKSWLRTHGAKAALEKDLPDGVRQAAYAAYFGGRIECAAFGTHRGPVTEYDICAAYPAAETTLPNFARGRWVHEKGPFCWRDRHPASLYHVHISVPDAATPRLFPLPWRESPRAVFFPNDETTWVWAPELEWVLENSPAWVDLVESWHFEEGEPTNRPLAFLADKYIERKRREAEGKHDLANALKLGSNSTYGATAQRVSARKTGKKPTYHNIAAAGLTTSIVRARVFRAAFEAWDSARRAPACIAIATDAVILTGNDPPPRSVKVGDGLGEWSRQEFGGCQVVGSGVYRLFPKGARGAAVERARGVRQRKVPWAKVEEAWRQGKRRVSFLVTTFVGHKRAKGSPRTFAWRTWVRKPRNVRVDNPGGKRVLAIGESNVWTENDNPAVRLYWTEPAPQPVLNRETHPNLPDFAELEPPKPRPDDFETCEADEDDITGE